MAERVNRPLRAERRGRAREPRDHGVPYAPVEGQLEITFEHSQHAEPETSR